jgi:hypothetical protein
MKYELLLEGRKVVEWSGKSGEDAARRYVDTHRKAVVIATREVQPFVTTLGRQEIIQ